MVYKGEGLKNMARKLAEDERSCVTAGMPDLLSACVDVVGFFK